MKKSLLSLLSLILLSLVLACVPVRTDYTVDEAFELMNDAIDEFLNAKSFRVNYHGFYENETYSAEERIDVRVRGKGTSSELGRAEMTIDRNATIFTEMNFYDGGLLYAKRVDNEGEHRSRYDETLAKFLETYTPWIKKPVVKDKTQNVVVVMDKHQIQVTFELSSDQVEATFYVPSVLTTVRKATATIVFTHDLKLISLTVTYPGSIQADLGEVRYVVTFEKINQYVIITQPSAAEKATYAPVSQE
jgi:hypothetical protein